MVKAGQCNVGAKTLGQTESQLVLAKMLTQIMTNSQAPGRKLSRKSDGKHDLQPLLDWRSQGWCAIPLGPVQCVMQGHHEGADAEGMRGDRHDVHK